MNNNEHLKALEEIRTMADKLSGTINESVMFNEENDITDDDFGDFMNDGGNMPSDEEMVPQSEEQPTVNPEANAEEVGMKELDEAGTIDQIRELTLKGMTRLCKTPEDPEYQALKKIFGMCDKSVDSEMKNQETQKPR